MLNHERSKGDFAQACASIPGGVNSPVRAFGKVGCTPVFYDHARGSHIWDVDGNEYIDFIGSWGPMILGHGDPDVLDAVRAQLDRGVSYGAPCEAEIRLAQMICEIVPNAERARMVSSGTEATMTAIRLARGRNFIRIPKSSNPSAKSEVSVSVRRARGNLRTFSGSNQK